MIARLFSNCIIVHGLKRTVICDLQLHKIHEIPKVYGGLFENGVLLTERIDLLDPHLKNKLPDFLKNLENLNLIFYCEENDLDHFPSLDLYWETPSLINNCILDAKSELWYFNLNFIDQLEQIGCNHIQIRFYEESSLDHLFRISELISDSQLRSVDLLIKFGNDVNFTANIKQLAENNKKIRLITLHSAPKNKFIKDGSNGSATIVEIKEPISDHFHCGVVHSSYFSINIETFSEAQTFNTCLNKKISVDLNGVIKNCPSMSVGYGNIKEMALIDALTTPSFKDTWTINKNQIEVCKGCEYRYICIDCRVFLSNPENIYSKPLKCSYDPNTGIWE